MFAVIVRQRREADRLIDVQTTGVASMMQLESDLRRLTLQQMLRHYRTYYSPNNATLVVAGDFDPASALRKIRRRFESIPRGIVPAALLATKQSPKTSMPDWCAAIASGTTDIATMSPPSLANARTSAGVS